MTKIERQPDLAMTVLTDLFRHPWILLLSILCVGSAFGVVLTSHHARLQNILLERQLAERDRLEVEWRHLLLEENALSEHSRISRLAEQQLQMHAPTAKDERVVRLP